MIKEVVPFDEIFFAAIVVAPKDLLKVSRKGVFVFKNDKLVSRGYVLIDSNFEKVESVPAFIDNQQLALLESKFAQI